MGRRGATVVLVDRQVELSARNFEATRAAIAAHGEEVTPPLTTEAPAQA